MNNKFIDRLVEAERKKRHKKENGNEQFKPLKGRDKLARKLARNMMREHIRLQRTTWVQKQKKTKRDIRRVS